MKLVLSVVICASLMCTTLAYTLTGTDKQVSLDMSCQKALSSVVCTFEFTNNGLDDVYILKRNTPLEGFLSPFIAVTSPLGYPLQYQGFLIYRTPLTKDEFVLLKAGKSITASIDITKAFSFNDNGLYTVQYIKPLEVKLMGKAEMMTSSIKTTPITLSTSASIYIEDNHFLSQKTYLEESEQEVMRAEREEEEEATIDDTEQQECRIRFIAGTQRQRANFRNAHRRICNKAVKVSDNLTNDSHYLLWFGEYTMARLDHVELVLETCASQLKRKVVTYHMRGPHCLRNVVAYTFWGSKVVFACSYMHRIRAVFCTNSNWLPDTQEGIMFHEWTHAFGFTYEFSFGAANDQQLALESPDEAVRNADNYERYYCPASFRAV